MKLDNPQEYHFLGFEQSTRKNKKYDAILLNRQTGSTKRISFGDSRYEQFKDGTGLNLYSHLDHNDQERRKRYLSRHEKDRHNKYSSGWFAAEYLW